MRIVHHCLSIASRSKLNTRTAIEPIWYFVMPNVKPAWMTLMIFSFQGLWNATGTSYIYSEQIKMLSAITTTITAGGIARTGVSAAAALLMMLPPILLFIFAQNNVIETMSSSGLKE